MLGTRSRNPPSRAAAPHIQERPFSSHDAAKESNLPSRGLPGPASFEDWQEPPATPRRYWSSEAGGTAKGTAGHSSLIPRCLPRRPGGGSAVRPAAGRAPRGTCVNLGLTAGDPCPELRRQQSISIKHGGDVRRCPGAFRATQGRCTVMLCGRCRPAVARRRADTPFIDAHGGAADRERKDRCCTRRARGRRERVAPGAGLHARWLRRRPDRFCLHAGTPWLWLGRRSAELPLSLPQ
jgi:hypothetical protein